MVTIQHPFYWCAAVMSKQVLQPQGNFPKASFWKRIAAMFYDSMLCIALVMVVTMLYQQGILRMIYGSQALQEMAESKMLDIDPVLSTLLFISLFAFLRVFCTTSSGSPISAKIPGSMNTVSFFLPVNSLCSKKSGGFAFKMLTEVPLISGKRCYVF